MTNHLDHDAALVYVVVENLADLQALLEKVRQDPEHPDFAYREEVLVEAIKIAREEY